MYDMLCSVLIDFEGVISSHRYDGSLASGKFLTSTKSPGWKCTGEARCHACLILPPQCCTVKLNSCTRREYRVSFARPSFTRSSHCSALLSVLRMNGLSSRNALFACKPTLPRVPLAHCNDIFLSALVNFALAQDIILSFAALIGLVQHRSHSYRAIVRF